MVPFLDGGLVHFVGMPPDGNALDLDFCCDFTCSGH